MIHSISTKSSLYKSSVKLLFTIIRSNTKYNIAKDLLCNFWSSWRMIATYKGHFEVVFFGISKIAFSILSSGPEETDGTFI